MALGASARMTVAVPPSPLAQARVQPHESPTQRTSPHLPRMIPYRPPSPYCPLCADPREPAGCPAHAFGIGHLRIIRSNLLIFSLDIKFEQEIRRAIGVLGIANAQRKSRLPMSKRRFRNRSRSAAWLALTGSDALSGKRSDSTASHCWTERPGVTFHQAYSTGLSALLNAAKRKNLVGSWRIDVRRNTSMSASTKLVMGGPRDKTGSLFMFAAFLMALIAQAFSLLAAIGHMITGTGE